MFESLTIVISPSLQSAVAKNMEATMASPSFMVSRKIRTDKFDELYAALKPKVCLLRFLSFSAVLIGLKYILTRLSFTGCHGVGPPVQGRRTHD